MNNDFYQSSNKQNKCWNTGGMCNGYSSFQWCDQKNNQSPDFDYKPVDDYKPENDCESIKPTSIKSHDDSNTTFNLVFPKDLSIIIKGCYENKKDDKKECEKKEKRKEFCKNDEEKKSCDKKDTKKKPCKKEDDKETTIIVTLKDVAKTVNDLITSLSDAGILD